MQSYGEFRLIPRNIANSSQTCMDKRPNFGQNEGNSLKSCPNNRFFRKNLEVSEIIPIFATS